MANHAEKEDNKPIGFTIITARGLYDAYTTKKYDIDASAILPNGNLQPGFYRLEGIQFWNDFNQQRERLVTIFNALTSLDVKGESKKPHREMRLKTIHTPRAFRGSYIKVIDENGRREAYKIMKIDESITQGGGKSLYKKKRTKKPTKKPTKKRTKKRTKKQTKKRRRKSKHKKKSQNRKNRKKK